MVGRTVAVDFELRICICSDELCRGTDTSQDYPASTSPLPRLSGCAQRAHRSPDRRRQGNRALALREVRRDVAYSDDPPGRTIAAVALARLHTNSTDQLALRRDGG